MTAPEQAAQAVLNALPLVPAGRLIEATIQSLGVTWTGQSITGLGFVVVAFPAGIQACRWLGSFAAEVVANPNAWEGRAVLLVTTGGTPIVLGSINTEG